MEYRESLPTPRLANYIKRFWSLEYDAALGAAEPETVLPDGCPEMIFNLSDRFKLLRKDGEEVQPATVFSGQLSRSITIRPTGRVALFGVRFQPAGAWPLGRISMHELTDEICDITDPLGSDGGELELKINAAASFGERKIIFEAFLVKRLASFNGDAIAQRAAALIQKSAGAISVTALADNMGVAERRLERRFNAAVGISPKMLARIVRFQGVVQSIQQAETPNMLDAVHGFGYFDQSHMIREFKEFSGDTPLSYFEKTHDLSDIFTSRSSLRTG